VAPIPETIDLDPTRRPTISVDELASVLDVARSTAFEAVRRGDVPAIRVGRRIRIPTAGVRRLLQLDSQTVSHGPDAA